MSLFRLMGLYIKVMALNELQYRVNFFMQLLQSLVALGTGLVGLALVFSHTAELGGWSRPELLAVMGVHLLMGGLIGAIIQPNMLRLMDEVRDGTLDFALTKPEDAQVLVSVREFRLWRLVDVALGSMVLALAVSELGKVVGLWQALGFGASLLLGALMIYSFWLMLSSTTFWIIRAQDMANLFEGVYAAGRWPVGIYPRWLSTGLTFLVPVAFAVTVPAEALTGRLTPQALMVAAVLALTLMLLARWVFNQGLRHYGGASA